MLFGVMAIQVKRKAPNCHTILEVVRLRWGVPAHLVRACNASSLHVHQEEGCCCHVVLQNTGLSTPRPRVTGRLACNYLC